MSVIISLAELANKFMLASNAFIKRVCDGPLLSREQCLNIVYLMLDDTVNSQMYWAKNLRRFELELERCIPWLRLRSNHAVSDDYLCEALDEIEVGINVLVERVIPTRTWMCWITKRVGSDALLVCGKDYRIMDWERRTRSGEWR
jgi:hypothetical protein